MNGERFWVEVEEEYPDGSAFVRVDNDTLPSNPQYNERIKLEAGTEYLDRLDVEVH